MYHAKSNAIHSLNSQFELEKITKLKLDNSIGIQIEIVIVMKRKCQWT